MHRSIHPGAMDGKVVVITGSTRGLGLAMAHAFLDEGASVTVSSRGTEATERAVATLVGEPASGRPTADRVVGVACDVGDLTRVEALAARTLERFGRLDVWINNAGASAPFGPTSAIDPAAFERVVRTNVLGTYHGSLAALRHFVPNGSGKLINLLGRGDRGPVPYLNAYASSKAWTRAFTRALADEHRRSGVGIFAFNPGLMRTTLMTEVQAIKGFEHRLAPLRVVLRLLATGPEIPARKAVWLASRATDGRSGLEVRAQGMVGMLAHALHAGSRWALGRVGPVEVHVQTVPPADR